MIVVSRKFAMQALEFGARVVAQLGVEIGQRFVEQQQFGAPDQRAADRAALLLAAAQRAGLARQRMRQAQHFGDLADALLDLVGGHARLAQRIGEIFEGRQMRIEREGLEHHRGVARAHGNVGDVAAVEQHPAAIGALDAGDDAQQASSCRRRWAQEWRRTRRARPQTRPRAMLRQNRTAYATSLIVNCIAPDPLRLPSLARPMLRRAWRRRSSDPPERIVCAPSFC